MQAAIQTNPTAAEFIADGCGRFHPADPRTGREPAGSGLLARAAAVREAQQAALDQAIATLAASHGVAGIDRDGPRARHIESHIFEFIARRAVIAERRDDTFYYVTLAVVFDMPALLEAIAPD